MPLSLWLTAGHRLPLQTLSEAGCRIDNTYTDLKIVIGLLA